MKRLLLFTVLIILFGHSTYAQTIRLGRNYTSRAYVADSISDSLTQITPQNVTIDIPDTVHADTDSMDVYQLADISLPSEYQEYLHFVGNGSNPFEKAVMVKTFRPIHLDVDSIYVWVRGSNASTDSTVGYLRSLVKTAADSTVIVADSLTVASANTWVRRAFAIDNGLEYSVYSFRLEIFCRQSNTFDVSPVYMK